MTLKVRGGIAIGNDIALTILFQGLSALISYGAQIVVSRTLGESGFDIYSLVFSYMILASALTDFGIVAVVYPRIAVAGGTATPAFFAALRLRAVIYLLGSFLVALGVVLVEGTELLLPTVCGLLVIVFSAKLTGVRQVAEMIWKISGRTWIVGAMTAFDSALFLGIVYLLGRKFALSPADMFLLLGATSVPTFLFVFYGIRRATRDVEKRYRRISPRYLRAILSAAFPIAVMAIASQVFGRIEPMIISRMIGIDLVGDYTNAVFPLGGTIFIPLTIAIGILPFVSQVHRARRSDFEMSWIISTGIRSIGAIAVLIGIVSFIFAEPILSLFGPAYVDDAWIMRIYTMTTLLEFIVIFGDQMLIATDRRRELMIATLLSLALVILFQVSAITLFGIAGVLYGKIGALTIKIAYQYRSFDEPIRSGLRDGIVRILLSAVISGGILFATKDLAYPLSFPLAMAGAIAILWFTKCIDPERLKRLRGIRLT